MTPLRLRRTSDLPARAVVCALFTLLSVNLFHEWARTGHVTGLLLLASESLVVVLTDVLDAEASGELVAHSLRLGRRHRVLVVAMSDAEVLAALRRPLERSTAVYEWAAAEELLSARRRAFETLQRGGVQCLDVEAGRLSPSVLERYLELKERGLI